MTKRELIEALEKCQAPDEAEVAYEMALEGFGDVVLSRPDYVTGEPKAVILIES